MDKQENKKGSWKLFLISIGLLFIMFSQNTSFPMLMIIVSLVIILMGIIMIKKSKIKESKNKK